MNPKINRKFDISLLNIYLGGVFDNVISLVISLVIQDFSSSIVPLYVVSILLKTSTLFPYPVYGIFRIRRLTLSLEVALASVKRYFLRLFRRLRVIYKILHSNFSLDFYTTAPSMFLCFSLLSWNSSPVCLASFSFDYFLCFYGCLLCLCCVFVFY